MSDSEKTSRAWTYEDVESVNNAAVELGINIHEIAIALSEQHNLGFYNMGTYILKAMEVHEGKITPEQFQEISNLVGNAVSRAIVEHLAQFQQQ